MKLTRILLLVVLVVGSKVAGAGTFNTQVMVDFTAAPLAVRKTQTEADTRSFTHQAGAVTAESNQEQVGESSHQPVYARVGWKVYFKSLPKDSPRAGRVTVKQVYVEVLQSHPIYGYCEVYADTKCKCKEASWHICKDKTYADLRDQLRKLAQTAGVAAKDALIDANYQVK